MIRTLWFRNISEYYFMSKDILRRHCFQILKGYYPPIRHDKPDIVSTIREYELSKYIVFIYF
ncbi:hypothetical protein GLOIN_2v1661197 [Rhizophagus irregularis DAOM 181602=DAOM 197198]|uniref:Uncharacterized protein n=1 Tax=Rhizophagus irregularis (strain DAOM 181602 / DAOM 197198 / MUCL 43194) TaxID=747089 RepID=A0A2P4PKR0_RHIID|nr:hypothetical protein GLOIN_2v1661197 [Rhizophagus irregularis DAOM 181602=DAOM 197198]POG65983.1 hypothetical protein GLOIN_2v1661197 [Rhizophagus irregularis DAOM 181602=DAOM 197198]|eukprot:XP_025172849.1 hypothetical protein GLOIN_2v1661197 [Rhizophagus irregularis DAOM 181602=DAOM 197198]